MMTAEKENGGYDLYSEFDIQKHKDKYINYLEVMIEQDGHVVYAVPSHQEKAIQMACLAQGWTRQELYDACPPEFYFDFMPWLLKMSGAVAVWTRWVVGEPNSKQKEKLLELARAGVYKGEIRTNVR